MYECMNVILFKCMKACIYACPYLFKTAGRRRAPSRRAWAYCNVNNYNDSLKLVLLPEIVCGQIFYPFNSDE